MVATSNPLAVEAALWALGEGGTAMDAALASDAVLGVVQPMSTGVGGDLFSLVDDGRIDDDLGMLVDRADGNIIPQDWEVK